MISVVVSLLLYTVVMLVAAPRLLRALTSSGTTPRLGVATWLSAIGTLLASWVAAAVLIVIQVSHWTHPRAVATSCLARLQHTLSGSAGIGPQIAVVAMAAAAAIAAVITGARITSAVLGMRSRAHEHARAVRVVGHRTGQAGVVMVEADKPAAYCVTGRPAAIVVTSAARDALDEHQMAAVLAHERAHLAGHHAAIVSTLRAFAAAFPRLSLITEGAQQVSRLLEMCADDVAARRHSSRALLSGLVALTTVAPAEALSAAHLAVLARAERLAAPPHTSMKFKASALLASVIAIMATLPVLAVAACVWSSHMADPGMGTDVHSMAGDQLIASPPSKTLGQNLSGKVNSMMMMMMNNGHWGWGGWLISTGMTIVFWALVITAVVLLARYLLAQSRTTGLAHAASATAEHTLAERYARGEIDDDEYQRRLGLMRGKTDSTTSI